MENSWVLNVALVFRVPSLAIASPIFPQIWCIYITPGTTICEDPHFFKVTALKTSWESCSRCGINKFQLAKIRENWIFWVLQLLWFLVWRASEQCLAVLREDAALQSNLSKMVTKELWLENQSNMQTSMCGTLKNAGIALRNLQLGFHCNDRLYPLCIWMVFRVSPPISLQIHLEAHSPPSPP